MRCPFVHEKCGGRDIDQYVTCRTILRYNEEGTWVFALTAPEDIVQVESFWCNTCGTDEGEFLFDPEEK